MSRQLGTYTFVLVVSIHRLNVRKTDIGMTFVCIKVSGTHPEVMHDLGRINSMIDNIDHGMWHGGSA